MSKYTLVSRAGNTLRDVVVYVETDVNKHMEEGYVLAGSLTHSMTDSDGAEWHAVIQPMILEDETE